MIISNPVVKLDYDPVTDILAIDWPDFTEFSVSEVEYILDSVVEAIRNYDIRYLLTDTRAGTVSIADERYNVIAYDFSVKLNRTRLKKIARIITSETHREQLVTEITRKAGLGVPLMNFDNEVDAFHWLTSFE